MRRKAILVTLSAFIIILLAGSPCPVQAQSNDLQKLEVGAHFTSLSLNKGFETDTEPGLGARVTYNLTRAVAIEAEANFFPSNNRPGFRAGGRGLQGLFGIKLGKRYQSFGIFGKARPGFTSYSAGLVEFLPINQTVDPDVLFLTRSARLTHFTMDIGGVLEFYPSRRIFTRLDAGDTIIRQGATRVNSITVVGDQFVTVPLTIPGDTVHNFQFSAGVGFRF
jgi:hypothetical protein